MRFGEVMATIADENATLPDIKELLVHIHKKFGGTKEYADLVVDDVKAAPTGSNQRLAFHNNYLASIAKFGGNDDLIDDPIALEAEFMRLVEEMNSTSGPY